MPGCLNGKELGSSLVPTQWPTCRFSRAYPRISLCYWWNFGLNSWFVGPVLLAALIIHGLHTFLNLVQGSWNSFSVCVKKITLRYGPQTRRGSRSIQGRDSPWSRL